MPNGSCVICGAWDIDDLHECPKTITDSDGHLESEDCWCRPTVERYPAGNIIIHNEPGKC